jgi:hypothetical protein
MAPTGRWRLLPEKEAALIQDARIDRRSVSYPRRDDGWRALPFNSDAYDRTSNTHAVGNGGSIWAGGGPLDGFASSA